MLYRLQFHHAHQFRQEAPFILVVLSPRTYCMYTCSKSFPVLSMDQRKVDNVSTISKQCKVVVVSAVAVFCCIKQCKVVDVSMTPVHCCSRQYKVVGVSAAPVHCCLRQCKVLCVSAVPVHGCQGSAKCSVSVQSLFIAA